MVKQAFLEITKNCNLRCTHCYLAGKTSKDLDTQTWYNIMDKIKEFGVKNVVLFGGEPTLRQDFYQLLQYAINNFDRVSVQTNGTTPTHFGEYECEVAISVEDATPKGNDIIRGEGVFEKAIRKFRVLKNPKVLRYTIYNDNDPLGIAYLAEKYGGGSVGISLKSVGAASNLVSKVPSSKRLLDVYRQIYSFNLQTEHWHTIEDVWYYILNPELYHKYYKTFLKRGRICGAGVYRMYIDAHGLVTPCMFLWDKVVGNILKDSVEKIKENLKRFNDKVLLMPKNGKCLTCTYSAMCNGGCIQTYLNSGIKKGIGCPVNKNIVGGEGE